MSHFADALQPRPAPLTVKYSEAPLGNVCQFFADAFHQPKPEIAEWFIDTRKQVVVFKLYIREAPPDATWLRKGESPTEGEAEQAGRTE